MKIRTLVIAAGAFLLSGGLAAAATVTNDLNLRSGPGTGYRVIGTMPAGAYVDVIGCSGSWCRVNWSGAVGYASASYLARGRGGYYAAAPVYVAPPPVVGFGFSFGNGPRWQRHQWHGHRGGWRGHHGRHHGRHR